MDDENLTDEPNLTPEATPTDATDPTASDTSTTGQPKEPEAKGDGEKDPLDDKGGLSALFPLCAIHLHPLSRG